MQHAPVAKAEAEFPLVIFSHGIGGNRMAYSAIICSLVRQVSILCRFMQALQQHNSRHAMLLSALSVRQLEACRMVGKRILLMSACILPYLCMLSTVMHRH